LSAASSRARSIAMLAMWRHLPDQFLHPRRRGCGPAVVKNRKMPRTRPERARIGVDQTDRSPCARAGYDTQCPATTDPTRDPLRSLASSHGRHSTEAERGRTGRPSICAVKLAGREAPCRSRTRNAPVDQVCAAVAVTRRVFDKAAEGCKYVRERTPDATICKKLIFTTSCVLARARSAISLLRSSLAWASSSVRARPAGRAPWRGPRCSHSAFAPTARSDAWFAGDGEEKPLLLLWKSIRCAPVTMMPSLPWIQRHSCDREVFVANSATHGRRPRFWVSPNGLPQIRARSPQPAASPTERLAPFPITAPPTSSFSRHRRDPASVCWRASRSRSGRCAPVAASPHRRKSRMLTRSLTHRLVSA